MFRHVFALALICAALPAEAQFPSATIRGEVYTIAHADSVQIELTHDILVLDQDGHFLQRLDLYDELGGLSGEWAVTLGRAEPLPTEAYVFITPKPEFADLFVTKAYHVTGIVEDADIGVEWYGVFQRWLLEDQSYPAGPLAFPENGGYLREGHENVALLAGVAALPPDGVLQPIYAPYTIEYDSANSILNPATDPIAYLNEAILWANDHVSSWSVADSIPPIWIHTSDPALGNWHWTYRIVEDVPSGHADVSFGSSLIRVEDGFSVSPLIAELLKAAKLDTSGYFAPFGGGLGPFVAYDNVLGMTVLRQLPWMHMSLEDIYQNLHSASQGINLPTTAPASPLTPVPVLHAPTPNPFNPKTTISFSLPANATGSLRVYDLRGQYITTLARGPFVPGVNEFSWNGHDARGQMVGSGTYIFRLAMPETVLSTKGMLVK